MNIVSRTDAGEQVEKNRKERERKKKKKNRSKNDYENGQFGRHENGDGLKHILHPRDFFVSCCFMRL